MIAMLSMQLAVGMSTTCAAGFLMVASGLKKRLLERPMHRICPTCGRHLEHRVCDVCSRPS